MVEPRRQCLALPAEDLYKNAVGGVLYVTVLSASRLSGSNLKGSGSIKQLNSSTENYSNNHVDKELKTFVEIELEELTRRTDVRAGSNPNWDATFNLVLHDNTGILRFLLYECTPGSIKYNYLTSCEIKVLLFEVICLHISFMNCKKLMWFHTSTRFHVSTSLI